ncbi:MAG: hypothetical protein JWM32_2559 [Verrucomicrobia bacterium]|nr:hypothetical protein [Verrucomicrobiota bacterium]
METPARPLTAPLVPAAAVGPRRIPRLGDFDRTDWNAISTAFRTAPALALRQAWRSEPEAGFRGASVKLGWRGAVLWFLAELIDDQIVTRAERDDQLLCELGDVFEVFARDVRREEYLELHTAPNGLTLRLRWVSREVFKNFARQSPLDISPHVGSKINFRPMVQMTNGGWRVCGAVALPAGSAEAIEGQTWLVSFGRYDASIDGSPTLLSSTSAHAIPDFHRQEEWTPLRFVGAEDEAGPRPSFPVRIKTT